jgi:hypothetical protein
LQPGCTDAPRDNPLDPLSPRYVGASGVSGKALVRDQNTGLSGALITSMEDNISTTTDANGFFSLERLSAGTQMLVCSKENFIPDTERLVMQSGTAQTVVFSLNGAPVVLSENIFARKIDQSFPSPQYFVDVVASVTDPNGITDLDSIWFSVDTLLFPMMYSTTSQQYQTTIYKYALPTNTIQWLVNKPLKIRSSDRHHAISYGPAFSVSRIIENTAVPTSPINGDSVTAMPVFRWLPPQVTFHYTYSVTIYRLDAGVPTTVQNYTGLNSVDEQYPASGNIVPLSSGNYAWAVTVVDDFGNYAQSKEAAFIVMP